MTSRIKLIKPDISFEELASDLKQIFDCGQLTKGQHADKFVSSLKAYTRADHAFLTTSATTALTMALKTIGVKAGDKVAVSDFSWPATCNVIEDLGAIPIFIDVDRLSYNMCPVDLAKKLNKCFSGVILVDAFGNPTGHNEIKEICKIYNIPMIQDSACAIGSSINGVKVGSIADLTCFSFHPRKLITTGEGGAILTNNTRYADWLKIKLNAGALGRKGHGLDFIDYGYNLRMSEIQALMGWKQLAKLDAITSQRNSIANEYNKKLEPLGFKRQKVDLNTYHNIQSLIFTVPGFSLRDKLIDHLENNNIESTIGTYSLSNLTHYIEKYSDPQDNSLWLQENTITLPCYKDVKVAHITAVIEKFFR